MENDFSPIRTMPEQVERALYGTSPKDYDEAEATPASVAIPNPWIKPTATTEHVEWRDEQADENALLRGPEIPMNKITPADVAALAGPGYIAPPRKLSGDDTDNAPGDTNALLQHLERRTSEGI